MTVLLGLALWKAAALRSWVDPLFVPAPSAGAGALVRIAGPALAALADTLGKTALAYVLSVSLGVAAGLAVGSVRLLRDVLSPYVIALYGFPKILVLPWIVLLLGSGTSPAVLYGTIHGLFPIMVLVMGAVRDVDRSLVTVARSFGATPLQLYWKVLLPAIVLSVLAGMRLGIGIRPGLVRQRIPGAGALRGNRARVGGLHRDRAGARQPERAALALARLIRFGPGLLQPTAQFLNTSVRPPARELDISAISAAPFLERRLLFSGDREDKRQWIPRSRQGSSPCTWRWTAGFITRAAVSGCRSTASVPGSSSISTAWRAPSP
jgi:binding-protein-dependent transport system inner membrane component